MQAKGQSQTAVLGFVGDVRLKVVSHRKPARVWNGCSATRKKTILRLAELVDIRRSKIVEGLKAGSELPALPFDWF